MFMRSVKSRNFFEQMKGRGVRVINPTDLQGRHARTPTAKTHFVMVDCVGVTEENLSDSPPLERKYSVAFETLLKEIAFGVVDADTLSSLAGRLARLDRQIGDPDRKAIAEVAGGRRCKEIVGGIIEALDPDAHVAGRARRERPAAGRDADAEQIAQAKQRCWPRRPSRWPRTPRCGRSCWRRRSGSSRHRRDQRGRGAATPGSPRTPTDRAQATVTSFQAVHRGAQGRDHRPPGALLPSLRAAAALQGHQGAGRGHLRPAPQLDAGPLWRAYETLDKSKVRGSGTRVLTDVVSLVRYAIGQDDELVPYPEQVNERFAAWLAQQEVNGRAFTAEQRAGWRRSGTTSRPACGSSRTISSTRRLRRRAGSGGCMRCLGRSCRSCWRS